MTIFVTLNDEQDRERTSCGVALHGGEQQLLAPPPQWRYSWLSLFLHICLKIVHIIPYRLLQCALRGAAFEDGPATATGSESSGAAGEWCGRQGTYQADSV